MRLLALAALSIVACGPAGYAPRGVLAASDVDAATFRNMGCLELAFGLRPPVRDDDVALLVVRVGNLCLHPTPFDLRGVAISGYDAAGARHILSLADPRGEIVWLNVDTRARGVEKVRLRAGDRVELTSICFDLRGVAPGSSHPPGPPFCFRPNGSYWTAS